VQAGRQNSDVSGIVSSRVYWFVVCLRNKLLPYHWLVLDDIHSDGNLRDLSAGWIFRSRAAARPTVRWGSER
jgi:hypothetical protein